MPDVVGSRKGLISSSVWKLYPVKASSGRMSHDRSVGREVAFNMASARWMLDLTWPTSGANWRHATFIFLEDLFLFVVVLVRIWKVVGVT